MGKFCFVNWSITNWNHLVAETLVTFLCKPKVFRKRFGKQL